MNFLQHFIFSCIYIIGLGFSTRQETGSRGDCGAGFLLCFPAGMMLQDGFVPGAGVNVGIDFRGEDTLVPQHFLDNP